MIVILAIVVIAIIVIGPARIAGFLGQIGNLFRSFQAGLNEGTDQNPGMDTPVNKKRPLRFVFGIAGLVGGYLIGSTLLPSFIYTRNELMAIQSSASYYSGLRADYSSTVLIGGIVGAILFWVIGMAAARLLENK